MLIQLQGSPLLPPAWEARALAGPKDHVGAHPLPQGAHRGWPTGSQRLGSPGGKEHRKAERGQVGPMQRRRNFSGQRRATADPFPRSESHLLRAGLLPFSPSHRFIQDQLFAKRQIQERDHSSPTDRTWPLRPPLSQLMARLWPGQQLSLGPTTHPQGPESQPPWEHPSSNPPTPTCRQSSFRSIYLFNFLF